MKGDVFMDRYCFNLSKDGRRCEVLKVKPCPEGCTARVSDPMHYIDNLEAMIAYNGSSNYQMVADLRKEVLKVRNEYDLFGPEFEKDPDDGKYADWKEVYYAERNRRSAKGGGASENNANPSKPRENDNRILETKWTAAEREELREETEKWELEHGKLPKLGYTSMSRSKIDSYTGEPIE